MAAKDIPMGDDELDALMAELEAETSGMVVAPAAKAAVVESEVPAAAEPEVDELEKQIEAETAAQAKREADAAAAAAQAKSEAEAALAARVAAQAEREAKAAAEAAQLENARSKLAIEPEPRTKDEPVIADPEKVAEAVTAAAATASKNKMPMRHHIDVDTFKADIAINDTNLDKCMMEQAGLRAWWQSEAARAEGQYSRTKAQFERAEAKLYDKHRRLAAASTEKVTEKMIENAVKMDDDWLRIKNAVIESQTIAEVARGCADSLRDRGMMLVQMASDRREEGKGQSRVMAANEDRASTFATAKALVGRA